MTPLKLYKNTIAKNSLILKLILLWFLTIGITSCYVVEPTDPGMIQYNPDTVMVLGNPGGYRALWDSVQKCTGINGNFERIKWFYYPQHLYSFEMSDGSRAAGYSDWKHHEIRFASNWTNQSFYVKHEMVHELLQRYNHPLVPFRWPCHLTEYDRDHGYSNLIDSESSAYPK